MEGGVRGRVRVMRRVIGRQPWAMGVMEVQWEERIEGGVGGVRGGHW